MRSNNTFQVLNLLVKKLQIPVTRLSIEDELQKNSEPDSLLAISETLDNWNIPNAAYSVTTDELINTDIPLPFIACFAKGEFVLVNQINKKQVEVSNDRWKNHNLTFEEFTNYYKGTILAFQKESESGEIDYFTKRRKEFIERLRTPFVITGLLIILLAFSFLNQSYIIIFNWHFALLTLFKSVGLITSILLLQQNVGANNFLMQKACGTDDNKNCNAILQSKAAKITDELSWSEVGFFYFAGTWLALLLNNGNSNLMPLLVVLNITSLPYTFYSIYYQWRIAKEWCIFCCTIQLILWLEFFALLPDLFNDMYFPNVHTWALFFVAMLLPVLIWVFIKPYLLAVKQLQILKPELYKYKYNKELFQNMLHDEVKYTLLNDEDTIIIGNREANNIITFVSNPFCVHCAKTHNLLDDLLNSRDDIKLQLIFIGTLKRRELDKEVMSHFMALKSGDNENNFKEALNDWYKQKKKDFQSWKKQYPAMENAVESKMLLRQKEWCNLANITSTPTLFINGRRLPSVYHVEDIRYIL